MSWDEDFIPSSIEEALNHGVAAFLCTGMPHLIHYLNGIKVLSIYMHANDFNRESWNDLFDKIKSTISTET